MNFITSSGGNKKQRYLAESVTNFMVDKILSRFKTLSIEIHISNLMKTSGVHGFCNTFSDRDFLIELDRKLNSYDFIETICHEMIHVKQHAKKELKKYNFKQKTVLWKNKVHTIDPEFYQDFPWEKEAYEYEYIYAKEYLIVAGVWEDFRISKVIEELEMDD